MYQDFVGQESIVKSESGRRVGIGRQKPARAFSRQLVAFVKKPAELLL